MPTPTAFVTEILSALFATAFWINLATWIGAPVTTTHSFVGGGLGAGFTAPGLYTARMQTKSASVYDAVAALREEISGIITNAPSDAEMKRAKESILNSFIFNYDSRAKILNQQLNYAYYGLPADYLETYRANIEKVTKDDVARVAKQYVKPDELTILIAGKRIL